ncbi:hypothetical protein AB0M83_07045 [Amycolatopsis sp. NPDC051106]|uniref:hypothetical protein n=1 Tax=unclassified Amycolatopsis TaxID=2618356 RepID=UPI00341D0636
MGEPFTLSLIWLGQTVGAAIVGRLAERAVDHVLGEARQSVMLPGTPPRRHRLGEETSDIDIVVHHTPAGRRPVLLAFQTAPDRAPVGAPSYGVTVPMVLGETAHLTLPRDYYLISALVLDPPAKLGGKPVLHGIGWIYHWAASTTTSELEIRTTVPTKKLLVELGLRSKDGTSPFKLPRSVAAPPRQLPRAASAPAPTLPSTPPSETELASLRAEEEHNRQCRARAFPYSHRCTDVVGAFGGNGLCLDHRRAWEQGDTVFDWTSRQPIT